MQDRNTQEIPHIDFVNMLYSLNKNELTKDVVNSKLMDILMAYDEHIKKYIDFSKFDNLVDEIYQRLAIEDKHSVAIRIERNLNEEFLFQIRNINTKDDAQMTLKIGRQKSTLICNENGVSIKDNFMKLRTQIAYVDDPFVIDSIDNKYVYRGYKTLLNADFKDHKKHLIEMLVRGMSHNTVEEIIASDRLKMVYDSLGRISEGAVVTEQNRLIYKEEGRVFRLSNLSTGLKTFVIIKMLLLNGAIEKNGTIILDEPEIHLHPEWQLIFAETIVLMQKEFNMHILINTHSPYFLEAIETYSKKHGIDEQCKYYLSCEDKNGSGYKLEDVSEHTEKIYDLLAMPFQVLENE